MPVIISVVILAFALSGFLFLPAFHATLWLTFWVAAFPVAYAFVRGEPLRGKNLVDIYKAGLTQVPFIGQLFATFLGSPSATSKGNAAKTKSTKRSRAQKQVNAEEKVSGTVTQAIPDAETGPNKRLQDDGK